MGPVVDTVDLGHKQMLTEEHSCCFNILDFANIEKERGEYVESPPALCHGINWVVELYPFGHDGSTKGYVAIYLVARMENDADEVKAKFHLSIKNSERSATATRTFTRKGGYGSDDFIKRRHVLDSRNNILVDGTLAVQADIQIYTDSPAVWTPKKSLGYDMLKMLSSGKSSDVTFQIDTKEFRAHRCVLECRAPMLAELAEDMENDNPIQLGSDVDADIFKMLLYFVYADEPPSDVNFREDAQKLLDMADKYGCTALKLLTESEIIKLGVTVENAATLLLYAKAKNCALLEEAAINIISANTGAVMKTEGWKNLKESPLILSEIMEMTMGGKKRKLSQRSEVDFEDMSVAGLREKSCKLGLDVDGSREMLVNRLKNASEE